MQDEGLVARFQSAPKETHVATAKRILRYMKGIVDYDIQKQIASLRGNSLMQIEQEVLMTKK